MEFEKPRWDEGILGSGSKQWLGRLTFSDETRDAALRRNAAGGNDCEGTIGGKATTLWGLQDVRNLGGQLTRESLVFIFVIIHFFNFIGHA